jgi:hypothetical protein
MSKHLNEKIVVVHRLQPFNHEAQKGLDEWFSNANQAVGSYFKKGGSKRVETGLEDWEAKILLPGMVNAEPSDKEFKTLVEKYYVDINTKIPSDGLILNIGLETDNSAVISSDNEPLNLEDYLIYRHARLHPHVAGSKEEGLGNPLVKFYVEDKSKESSALVNNEKLKDEALLKYLEVAKDANKVDMYLSVLGINYKNISPEERPLALKNKANDNPKLFIDILNDKSVGTRFFINKLVSADIIVKEGNRYLLEGEQLAVSTKDFVLYLEDKVNSETVGVLKARQKELAKA